MLSQLSSSGKVKKIFAHCLDSKNGGGIFAVGDVVLPEVKTTPLVPNQYVAIHDFRTCHHSFHHLCHCLALLVI